MKIGTTIRAHRLQKGLSQGDIEKGLACCAVIFRAWKTAIPCPRWTRCRRSLLALDLPIAQFFADDSFGHQFNTQKLNDEELRFLTQIRRYSSNLNESDRKLLLAMIKKFAAHAPSAR